MNRRLSKAPQSVEEPSVNLTPLIDVVFVILIMFIVIAPLLELDRIELASAGDDKDTAITVQENSKIAIHVRKDNTILFNNRLVSLQQLPKLLQDAKRQYPTARPQLYHDRYAQFGTYQSIKNVVEAAGFEQMDVVLKPN